MNVYDEAHGLARAIQGSEEYIQYMEAKEKIAGNSELEEMLKDFQGKQMNIQAKQMMGEEINEDVVKNVQELYAIITKDPLAAQYLQCEMRFSLMMQDVYKILGEVVSVNG